jgi:histidinol-phosphate aminotransferase
VSWVSQIARPDIVALEAYEHAAWEPELTRLHANELPWRIPGDESRAGLNRYPEPQPRALIERLAGLYRVAADALLVGRGSDEAIDLLVRSFCRAGEDAVLVCTPTFGMYALAARIQGARLLDVPLRASEGFALDVSGVLARCTPAVKLVFLCSPNNPTGNLLSEAAILAIADALAARALVVVDEAYIEFAGRESLAQQVRRRPQLAVLRTLSKAHGLAGVRCGTLIADPEVIALLRKVIAPYAIPQLALEALLALLEPPQLAAMRERIAVVRAERERMREALARLPGVTHVWPSDANFLLAQFTDATAALERARAACLLVRDTRAYPGLPHALRITVGTAPQNEQLLEAWR